MVICFARREARFTTEDAEDHREESGSLFLRALYGLCDEGFAPTLKNEGSSGYMYENKC